MNQKVSKKLRKIAFLKAKELNVSNVWYEGGGSNPSRWLPGSPRRIYQDLKKLYKKGLIEF